MKVFKPVGHADEYTDGPASHYLYELHACGALTIFIRYTVFGDLETVHVYAPGAWVEVERGLQFRGVK